MRPAQRLRCALCGLLLLSLGCVSGSNTRKKSSAKIAKNVTSSAPELSSRNQSLLAFYSAEIETAADKIISESPSRTARRQALEWKAEAIPVLQTSLLNTDPIAAVLDTWAFIFQMSAYMERPALKQALGDSHAIVAETVKNMNVEIERTVRLGSPTADVADLRQWISNWADAHPIQASLAGRRSLDPDLISKAEQSDLGTMDSLKALLSSGCCHDWVVYAKPAFGGPMQAGVHRNGAIVCAQLCTTSQEPRARSGQSAIETGARRSSLP